MHFIEKLSAQVFVTQQRRGKQKLVWLLDRKGWKSNAIQSNCHCQYIYLPSSRVLFCFRLDRLLCTNPYDYTIYSSCCTCSIAQNAIVFRDIYLQFSENFKTRNKIICMSRTSRDVQYAYTNILTSLLALLTQEGYESESLIGFHEQKIILIYIPFLSFRLGLTWSFEKKCLIFLCNIKIER